MTLQYRHSYSYRQLSIELPHKSWQLSIQWHFCGISHIKCLRHCPIPKCTRRRISRHFHEASRDLSWGVQEPCRFSCQRDKLLLLVTLLPYLRPFRVVWNVRHLRYERQLQYFHLVKCDCVGHRQCLYNLEDLLSILPIFLSQHALHSPIFFNLKKNIKLPLEILIRKKKFEVKNVWKFNKNYSSKRCLEVRNKERVHSWQKVINFFLITFQKHNKFNNIRRILEQFHQRQASKIKKAHSALPEGFRSL